MVELRLYSYGPKTSVTHMGRVVEIGPDVFIAAEGAGTFEGVSVERKISKLLSEGKDIAKTAAKIHRESTRRGHASMTTSLHLQMEVSECSRALSMLLVAPPFGSYLQESQRRAAVTHSSLVTPRIEDEKHRRIFTETAHMLVDAYKELVKQGIELEDARYLLPLCTRTSLFISSTFETYASFMQLSQQHLNHVPEEVFEFAEKLKKIIFSVAPAIAEARLWFKNRLSAYPFPNPFKPRDQVMERIVGGKSHDEPEMLSLVGLLDGDELNQLFSAGVKEVVDSLNPLLTAVFLEPMSLAAYHQAIRHRTVPTAVESIYTAAAKAVRRPAENIIIPPAAKKTRETKEFFVETVEKALQNYGYLVDDGLRPSTAVLLLPQALKIHVVRAYNAFNLLHPSGFVATRTCSYAQWEERGIAYKILHEVVKRIPQLGEVAGEKCRQLGFCPEKSWCPIILKYHHYTDQMHENVWNFD
ncbi:MAG: FAD-dependent thymidylate synthase [Candidatus Caldarchaeum sp.]|nr:FAD-dependent thymidylate synthase [Candidatus Caldarchaeum sp.]